MSLASLEEVEEVESAVVVAVLGAARSVSGSIAAEAHLLSPSQSPRLLGVAAVECGGPGGSTQGPALGARCVSTPSQPRYCERGGGDAVSGAGAESGKAETVTCVSAAPASADSSGLGLGGAAATGAGFQRRRRPKASADPEWTPTGRVLRARPASKATRAPTRAVAFPPVASLFDLPLPEPTPVMMGSQPKRYQKVYGYRLDDPSAIPRGGDRYLLCKCGWVVHLTSAGRADSYLHGALPGGPGSLRHVKAQRYRHDAATACTNYECTGRADHKRKRSDHYKVQVARHRAIHAGEARLVCLLNDRVDPPTS